MKSFFSLNTAASVQTTRVPRPQRDSMGKKAVAKEFGVAFEPGPMGPMVDAAVDRALSLAFGPGARPALAIFFHHALLALSVCLLIAAGSQHNVIPGEVKLVVDVRVNDCYSNAEINELLQREAPLELKARSLRLGSSAVRPDHPLVIAGKNMGRETYGSPTLSDQAAISGPSMKLGPGDSTRSHTADEFIYRHEIAQGIEIYSTLLETYLT